VQQFGEARAPVRLLGELGACGGKLLTQQRQRDAPSTGFLERVYKAFGGLRPHDYLL
jgi:hypothetical protein